MSVLECIQMEQNAWPDNRAGPVIRERQQTLLFTCQQTGTELPDIGLGSQQLHAVNYGRPALGGGGAGRWRQGQREPHLDCWAWAGEGGAGAALKRRRGCVGHLIHRVRSRGTAVRRGGESGAAAADGDPSWVPRGARALAGAPPAASALVGCDGGAGQSPCSGRATTGRQKHAHRRGCGGAPVTQGRRGAAGELCWAPSREVGMMAASRTNLEKPGGADSHGCRSL